MIGFGASICYSRMFLGVHSLDQVLFGSLLGIWFSLTLHYCLRDLLREHINDLLNKPYIGVKAFKYSLVAFGLYLTYTIVFFVLLIKLTVFNTEWEQQIQSKCGSHNWTRFFVWTTAMSTTDFNSVVGAYWGIHF